MKIFKRLLAGSGLLLIIGLGVLAWQISYNTPCPEPQLLTTAEAGGRAVRAHCYGGPEVLQIVETTIPEPGPKEIRVRVARAAVNPLDYHFMRGAPYVMRLMTGTGAPSSPGVGRDFAGTVDAVGSEVTRFKVGDRVFGGANGAFSDYIVRSETGSVAAIPDNASFDQAASLPVAAITALQAIRDQGEVKPGDKVLINGASGGVGTYAVQLAKAMGAEVHGVCSTRNVAMVKDLGADKVYDYKKEDYREAGERYDVIIDNVGNHSLRSNHALLVEGGRMVLVGGSKGNWVGPLIGPVEAMLLSLFVDESVSTFVASLEQVDLEALAEYLARGELDSQIDRHYPLEQVADAVAYSESGRARGKILLDITP